MSKRKPLSDNPKPAVRAKLVAFAHYYRGHSDAKVRGNSKACYQLVSDRASDATAESMGSLYLNHPIVQEILQESAERLTRQADITQAEVLAELAKMAFFDIRNLFHGNGTPKAINELDDATAAAIAGLDTVNIGNSDTGIGQILKYKLADKKGALELIGKNLKMWTDKVDVSNPDGSLAHRDVPDEELDARISELERQVGRGQ